MSYPLCDLSDLKISIFFNDDLQMKIYSISNQGVKMKPLVNDLFDGYSCSHEIRWLIRWILQFQCRVHVSEMWDWAGSLLAESFHCYSRSRQKSVWQWWTILQQPCSLEINLKSSSRELMSSATTQKLDCTKNCAQLCKAEFCLRLPKRGRKEKKQWHKIVQRVCFRKYPMSNY